MDISNKTLSVLLIAAIVVSLGGMFISLNRLDSISTTGYQAYAEENVSGDIRLDIAEKISITVEDSSMIDFGQCELQQNSLGITINSERGEDTITNCPTGAVSQSDVGIPIAVRNNGNVRVSVEFNASKIGTDFGGDFLNTGVGDDSSLRYKIVNSGWNNTITNYNSGIAGCDGLLGTGLVDGSNMTVYETFQTTNLVNACTNLSSGSLNSFLAHFEIRVPDSASAGDNVTITFVAQQI